MVGAKAPAIINWRKIIMARIKLKDGGDRDEVLDYIFPITGKSNATAATTNIAVATIIDGDVVLCQAEGTITASYIQDITVSSLVGFNVKFNTNPGGSTVNWAVFHANQA